MFNPEDDFDIDDGLDLGQFDYNAEAVASPASEWNSHYYRDTAHYGPDYGWSRPHHGDVEHYETHDARGYPRSRPYVAEFDENIVFKPHPVYETTPNEYARPFSAMPRSGAYRESTRSRKPTSDRCTSHEARKLERQHTRESFRNRPAYPATVSHYEPRRSEEYRSQRPKSAYASSDKYSMTRDWLSTEKFDRNATRKSKREKVRKFPPPEANAPAIPPPDYEDDDTSGVLYVPHPDYR